MIHRIDLENRGFVKSKRINDLNPALSTEDFICHQIGDFIFEHDGKDLTIWYDSTDEGDPNRVFKADLTPIFTTRIENYTINMLDAFLLSMNLNSKNT
jgi:hypothetical protein